GPHCFEGKVRFGLYAPYVACDPARSGVECVFQGEVCPTFDGGPPDAALPDAALSDAAPPEQPASCVLSSTSTIPGVHIEFPPQPCAFTLAGAAQGVVFRYDIVVDDDLPGYVSRNATPSVIQYPGQAIAGLRTATVITGGGQRYCLCDQGAPYNF